MRHIVIQVESIMKYPPTLSLLKILSELGEEVYLFTSVTGDVVEQECSEINIKLIDLGNEYSPNNKALDKLRKIPLINHSIKSKLNELYNCDTAVWVMTSITLKYIGNLLDNKRYIMYMYELSQEILYYPRIPALKVNLKKLFKNASAVVECEYNRAHIAKAWFSLKKTPYVIPNKPYLNQLTRESNIQDEYCAQQINKIKDKKIVLYQGIIDPERPLIPFIEAVTELGDEYAMVIMSSDVDKLKDVKSSNLCLLPFVNPPHHLEITSWAHIGILTYVPVLGETTSPLNAVYCAPNKIYEYAMFGIPMIGNDVPGLKTEFDKSRIGYVFDSFDKKDILEAIKKIEINYEQMSAYTFNFYNQIDNKQIFKELIRCLQ
jgi:glycosyltransferase involved in cell wall biosynthesis